MDLFLSILITLFIIGVVLAIAYTIVAFVLEKKNFKNQDPERAPQEEEKKE